MTIVIGKFFKELKGLFHSMDDWLSDSKALKGH
jgi:hypothetical protein